MFETKGPRKHRLSLKLKLTNDEKKVKLFNSDFIFIFWIMEKDLQWENEEQKDWSL